MKNWFILSLLLFISSNIKAQLIANAKTGFPITSAAILVEENAPQVLKKSASLLQKDIEMVTGKKLPLLSETQASTRNYILIGETGSSALLRSTALSSILHLGKLSGKWEAYLMESAQYPAGGMANVLVLAGSDRRGAAYAVFEFSRKMGVSPWYWWADVPVKKKQNCTSITGFTKPTIRG